MASEVLSESQYSTLETLNVITALISLVSILAVWSVLISVGLFGFRKERVSALHSISVHKLSFSIIGFIFLSDLFRMIGHLLPTPSGAFFSDYSCRSGAFFKLFGSLSVFLWMNTTSYIVYRLLLKPQTFDKNYVQRIKRIFHGVSWPIALAVAIIPLAADQYTIARADGPWCFIDDDSSKGMMMAFVCYYLWLLVAWCLVILVYIGIGRLLVIDYKTAKRCNEDSINIVNHNKMMPKVAVPTIERLQYFPLIFIFCFLWEILSIFYDSIGIDDVFIIKILQITATNLYSTFNALLFLFVIYNFNSNQMMYRNPKNIGKSKDGKKQKKKKKSKRKKSKKNKHSISPNQQDAEPTVTDTHTGVVVTATTITHQHVVPTPLALDEFSGHTVSLGIGNITVMTPTGTVTSMFDSEDEDLETVDMAPSNEEGDKIRNIIFGYNEDESDYIFSQSGSGSDIDVGGNIEVIEEKTELEPLSVRGRDLGRRLSGDPHDGFG